MSKPEVSQRMNTYIAMLRGINVSGQKKIKMADLKLHIEELGFINVQTYIQSGNIIFQSPQSSLEVLKESVEKMIFRKYGFKVPTIIKRPSELKYLLKNNPFFKDPEKEPDRMYITFLSAEPDKLNVKKLDKYDYSPEEFVLDGDAIFFYSPHGYGKARMNNNFFENKLKLHATTRNWKTVNVLFQMAEEIA